MGNKVPVADVHTDFGCFCFNNAHIKEKLCVSENLGSIVTLKSCNQVELIFEYEKEVKGGHVYNKKN